MKHPLGPQHFIKACQTPHVSFRTCRRSQRVLIRINGHKPLFHSVLSSCAECCMPISYTLFTRNPPAISIGKHSIPFALYFLNITGIPWHFWGFMRHCTRQVSQNSFRYRPQVIFRPRPVALSRWCLADSLPPLPPNLISQVSFLRSS